MSMLHQVAGPVIVTWDTTNQLGYSRDGAQIRIEPRWIDVFSDEYGGASGAPADAQLVGAVAHVSCDLTKYEQTYCHALTAFTKSGSAGVLPAFGTLIRQDTKYAPLLLNGSNEDWTFSVAFVRQAIEVNKGTRFSTFVLNFECWVNSASARQLFIFA